MFMSKLSRQAVSRFDWPVAQTLYGKIRGVEKEGGFIFRGVPYAKAKRFRLPEAPDKWEGVRECLAYGPDAPLHRSAIAKDQQYLPHYYNPESEDCQNLIVWTQHLGSEYKRPVIFWLHGAGFGAGAATEQEAYDGEELSRFGDVVFVAPNFRLNSLACLDLSSFGNEYADSSLCGIADLIMALRWVHDNIAFFGGDPDRVTLVGHAGGAPSVVSLMQSPAADGFYHRVSVGSGLFHAFTPPEGYTHKSFAQRLGCLTVKNLGLTEDTIREIDSVPYWFLSDAVAKAEKELCEETGISRYPWGPVPDNVRYFDYHSPADLRDAALRVPFMLGIDMGDSSTNARVFIGDRKKNTWDHDTIMHHLHDMYGDEAEVLLAEFRRAYPGRSDADLLFVDRKTRYTHFPLIENLVSRGVHVWNWMFGLELPINSGTTPLHCIDNAFITHNAEYSEATYIPGVTEDLQDKMAGFLVAFAETGCPQTPCLPLWPEAKLGILPTMFFDRKTDLRINHDLKLQKMMEKWHIH